jgi:hypothetical protein
MRIRTGAAIAGAPGVAAAVLLSVAGCGSDASDSSTDGGLTGLGLVSDPPANLIRGCERVSRQTELTVYCPPIVPQGPVEAPAHRQGNAYVAGQKDSYFLSLSSESLARSAGAFNRNHGLAEGHWVIAAQRPARLIGESVDRRVQYPHAKSYFGQRRRSVTVDGVRATIISGNTTGAGFASSDHAIVYWRIGNTGYLASAHDRFSGSGGGAGDESERYVPIVAEIARGLINQMVECPPRSPDPESRSCDWVFPAK